MKDKILIVDDIEVNRIILKDILQNDYEIEEAEDGLIAVETIFSAPVKPDAVLLDIMMPNMDGFEVLAIMQTNPDTAKIPVLFITAADSLTTESKGLREGAVDYVSKPFNPDVIKARLENHIQLARYRNQLEEMVEKKTNDLMRTHQQMLETMATIIEYRSLESGMHIRRTTELTKILVGRMLTKPKFHDQLEALDSDSIIKAVAMHDIGKVGIPDNILLKPGRLTPEEFEIIKTHATIGSSVIDNIASALTEDTVYLRRCREICRHHHERWDGNGYPDKLKGEEIPLAARILAVVDVYEALVSERCYKPPMTHEQAYNILVEGRGTHFCPDVIDIFIEVNEEFAKVPKTDEKSIKSAV